MKERRSDVRRRVSIGKYEVLIEAEQHLGPTQLVLPARQGRSSERTFLRAHRRHRLFLQRRCGAGLRRGKDSR